ncbi:MAG: DUF3467 domain-containing protein [Candidatus Hatepunaea meridiana]|nr:DUF3467 domain-containing protein [Candidatus Hatepunaea meridiana]
MNQPAGGSKQIQVQLDEKVGQGIYANLALISHSGAEFVVDFTRMLPGMPKATVQSRIILTPQHAKGLLKALEDNIKKFEEKFGEIKSATGKQDEKNFGFQTGGG